MTTPQVEKPDVSEREALREVFKHAVKHATAADRCEQFYTGSARAKKHRAEADAAREALLDAALARPTAIPDAFYRQEIEAALLRINAVLGTDHSDLEQAIDAICNRARPTASASEALLQAVDYGIDFGWPREIVEKIGRIRAADKLRGSLRPTASTQAVRPGPVTQAWTHGISMMQQSVVMAAIRGPDGLAKYGGGAKMLLRWFRRCVLLSAMDGRVLEDPIEPNGGSFTGPSLDGPDDIDPWHERMQAHVEDYLRQVDALPHHFQMHFLHAVEIVGYKHPAPVVRHFWHRLYLRLVNDFHMHPETELELDKRLGDTRAGWLERADPATTA